MCDNSSMNNSLNSLSCPSSASEISQTSVSKNTSSVTHNTDIVNSALKEAIMYSDYDDSRSKLSLFLHQLAGHSEDCISIIDMEHSYSRPWNWRMENNNIKPVQTLFVNKCSTERVTNENVDVESVPNCPAPPYDILKAHSLMDECEKQVSFVRPDANDENNVDWEERIDKTMWSPAELRIFNKVIRILNSDRLSRLTYQGHWNEPVMRRITIDKSARRFRQAMAQVNWDMEIIHWLHNLLIENLSSYYLAAYIEIIQTLKSKIPQLMERMVTNQPTTNRSNSAIAETLNNLVKRPWDAANHNFIQQKMRKLPGGPLILMVPYCPGPGFTPNSRPHHWLAYLSTIGTVISVVPPQGLINVKSTIGNCVDQLVASTRSKIAELRSDYPGRAIILVGMYSGSVLACQVALVENVTAVVCLGFPLYTVDDKRGQPDDSILDLQVPVMFVVGQNSSLLSIEEIEEMRELMHTVTGLVVVGGADDQLRISKSKKMREGVTQGMVDRCILDEVSDFLGTILTTPYIPQRTNSSQHSSYSDYRRTPLKSIEKKRKMVDTKMDTLDSSKPAKRGRKPKTLSIKHKLSNGGDLTGTITSKWTSTGSTGTTTISTRPVVSQVSGVSSSSGVNVVSGGMICKQSSGTQLTGLRLAPSSLSDTRVSKSNSDIKTVQLSIQGSVVRSSSAIPNDGGSITVVASAPASQPVSTSGKDIVIQVANSSKTRNLTSSSHLTSLSSLLQPTPTIVLSPSKSLREESQHLIPTSIGSSLTEGINQSNLVEELTPDRILELPVIFEDQQPMESKTDSSTVKVILGNNSGGMKKQQTIKPTIPAVKYIKKNHPHGMKYTKIYLRKKDESTDSSTPSVYVEELNEDDLNASRGSRLRHIPATEHSQFC